MPKPAREIDDVGDDSISDSLEMEVVEHDVEGQKKEKIKTAKYFELKGILENNLFYKKA